MHRLQEVDTKILIIEKKKRIEIDIEQFTCLCKKNIAVQLCLACGCVCLVCYLSAARSLSAPWVTTPMLQSTQRANPSLSSSSAMLPFYKHLKKIISQVLCIK